jgi:UDP-2-acetamido-3-amino-2,3-dideoxy-glucuronate N-acetyltransferase
LSLFHNQIVLFDYLLNYHNIRNIDLRNEIYAKACFNSTPQIIFCFPHIFEHFKLYLAKFGGVALYGLLFDYVGSTLKLMVVMDISYISEKAIVEDSVVMHAGVRVWHFSHIRENVILEEGVVVGTHVYIGPGILIGKNSKIQNRAAIYEPARIGEGVFIGPGAIITNDRNPRAINPNKSQKTSSDWHRAQIDVLEGASIGAGAICVGPISIGKWALVAAGAIVVDKVPNFALVAGVPAKQIGWVGKAGVRLIEQNASRFLCPITQMIYNFNGGQLQEAST